MLPTTEVGFDLVLAIVLSHFISNSMPIPPESLVLCDIIRDQMNCMNLTLDPGNLDVYGDRLLKQYSFPPLSFLSLAYLSQGQIRMM